MPLQIPEHFGRYHIQKKLGEGGMGAVYLAEDTKLRRRVALKIPHFSPEEGSTVMERFYREARMAAQIEHPNLCPVHDVDAIDGIHYITMAYIDGTPLSKMVSEDHPWQPTQAVELVRQLALALQYLHEAGIIHRDLKPGNVMIRKDGTPVLMDFGLARSFTNQSQQITGTNHPMGTPAYMSPEQVMGDANAIGPHSDVYSLAVILYELLTGRIPFRGTVMEVFANILHSTPAPPSQLRPGIPPQLDAICLKAMAKHPAERPPSMKIFADWLTRYLQEQGTILEGTARLPEGRRRGSSAQIPALRTPPPDEATHITPWGQQPPPSAWQAPPPQQTPTPWGQQPGPPPGWQPSYGAPSAWQPGQAPQPGYPAQPVAGYPTMPSGGYPAPHGTIPQAPAPAGSAWHPAVQPQPPPGHGHGFPILLVVGLVIFVACVGFSVWLFLNAGKRNGSTSQSETSPTTGSTEAVVVGPTGQGGTPGIKPSTGQTGRTQPQKPPGVARLKLRPLEPISLETGTRTAVPIEIDLENVEGDIQLRPEKVPSGLTIPEAKIVAGMKKGRLEVSVADAMKPGRYSFTLLAQTGKVRDQMEIAVTIKAVVLVKEITNSIDMKLVRIPTGDFNMGAPQAEVGSDSDERPQHKVTLKQAFYMGVYEVTQAEYQQVMGTNPSFFSRTGAGMQDVAKMDTNNFPVESVPWSRAVEFCQVLSQRPAEKKAGRVYRLPTEAEWEYACRAGTATPFNLGATLSSTEANFNGSEHPYPKAEPGPFLRRTTSVGAYSRANAWGLFDMHGNVREWCQDTFAENYYDYSPPVDPPGPTGRESEPHVVRGGAWLNYAANCRSAKREKGDRPDSATGFRVVCIITSR